MANQQKSLSHIAEGFSGAVSRWTGSTTAFACAVGVLLLWGGLGPVFGYSDTWQLVINTGTTVVTFLMVFLIQRSQNKDALALHLKLNELVAAVNGASNRLIDVEDLSEEELRVLACHYTELAALARKESDISQSHSIDEARARHGLKIKARGM
jgi:low affinity Fe/Cu permease